MTSGALHEIQLMLQRWQNPSAWDRIAQDEPLDPVGGKWVADVATNFTSTMEITIPIGTVTTNTGVILVQTGYSDIEHRIMAELHDAVVREADRDVFMAIERACAFGDPRNTRGPGQRWGPDTSAGGQPEVSVLPCRLPYARNRKEKRILKALYWKLDALIRQAEAILGERGEMAQDKWNAGFWDMVTRENPEKQGHKRKV